MQRASYTCDGSRYAVVEGDLYPWGRLWQLWLEDVALGKPEGFVYLPDGASLEEAARRLLGSDAVRT